MSITATKKRTAKKPTKPTTKSRTKKVPPTPEERLDKVLRRKLDDVYHWLEGLPEHRMLTVEPACLGNPVRPESLVAPPGYRVVLVYADGHVGEFHLPVLDLTPARVWEEESLVKAHAKWPFVTPRKGTQG